MFRVPRRKQETKQRAELPADFDAAAYLELNPDVKKAGEDPAGHYLAFGRSEGRPYRYYAELPADFNPDVYLALHPDVKKARHDPTVHYRTHGALEGRAYKIEDRLPSDFSADVYGELNPDVRTSGLAPDLHYVIFGEAENRRYKYDEQQLSNNLAPTYRYSIQHYSSDYKDDAFAIDPKLIAFYLPQFHRVKENDEWWGEGFTEWTNVRKAKPNYVGHPQPHVPAGQDYYDLADVAVQVRQARLAKEYGISAFCYYMYWFNGRRVLERPLDQMLANRTVDIPFCICWANENWTRTWDGKANDVLLAQVHSPENDRRFILDAMKYLKDPRYLRIDGRLVLLVYRTDLLPDCKETAAIWREEVRRAGLGELHLCAVQFYGITDPTPWGFDAAVEFPPHGWLVQENLPDTRPELLNDKFNGYVFDYDKSVDYALRKPIPDYRWYRGVFPGWDNTARRQDTPHIFHNSNPLAFERWLTEVLRQTVLMAPREHQVVFVNAWNEWAEGAHLEPDQANGMLNLMAVNAALKSIRHESQPLAILSRLRRFGEYPERSRDERLLLNLLRGNEQSTKVLTAMLRNKGSAE
ncbi:glycosyltransferase WbsX family protein [Methylobacterium oryzisoli]|uniref:glycosyltransferase WbsX family protein n=1 Tax=Methylobacterium oryzisoli TaxID=3385502 RepID=UPI003891B7B6